MSDDRPSAPPEGKGGPQGKRVLPEGPSPARFAGFGIQLLLTILLFLYLGRWLDGKFGTAPFLLIAGVFVGAAAGFYAMVKALSAERETGDKGKRQ